MTTHDLQLWSFATKELELGEHRFIASHLEECPECVEQLASIQVAQEALELARDAKPKVAWLKTDERIGAMVEKRLARQARRPMFIRLGAVGAFAMAAAVALFFFTREPVQVELVPPVASVPEAWARVDRAEGLSLVNGGGEIVDGTELRGGDVLRTSMRGRAFVHLPDMSHVRVGGGSQVTLTRSDADDVALTLERGFVAVRASHQPRKGFVIHTGGVAVHVVGTVFGVSNDADAVEVSVTEGKVRVELPNGEQTFVEPGQRLRFDSHSQKVKRLKVSAAASRELNEIAAVADATASVEQRAMVPAAGGTPSSPPMLVAQGAPRTLPRISAAESRARQVTAPASLASEDLTPLPKIAEQPKTEVIIEAPADVWPTLGGGEVIRGVPPRRESEPVSQPTEWAAAPVQAVQEDEWAELPVKSIARLDDEEPAPAPVEPPKPAVVVQKHEAPVAASAKPLSTDLEAIFMQRADDSLNKGNCDRFLLGLEDIAQDGERNTRSEWARVLRARCFDSQLRPRQAMNEYRKYLEEYPKGQYLAEANHALGR
ncbi:MAG: FecR domain-containing protein [Archangium sp.]